MTEKSEEEKKISGIKLSLKKNVDVQKLQEEYIKYGTSSLSVEVRHNKAVDNKENNFHSVDSKTVGGKLTEDEILKKMHLLKNIDVINQEKQSLSRRSALAASEEEARGDKNVIVQTEENDESKDASLLTTEEDVPTEIHDKTSDKENKDDKQKIEEEQIAISQQKNKLKDAKDSDFNKQKDLAKDQNIALDDKKIVVKSDVKRVKYDDKRLHNSDIIKLAEHSADISDKGRERSVASIRRSRDKHKRKQSKDSFSKIRREITINEALTVSELAIAMAEKVNDVIKEAGNLGIKVTQSNILSIDIAELLVITFGHVPKYGYKTDIESILRANEDNSLELRHRPPIVTVMGHVDHGKTSLLESFRSIDMIKYESGGITQSIGAYLVSLSDGGSITFIDTPGHAAFSAMRSRGASITDIIVLVVAADDSIKVQTIEAIKLAHESKVPIIVAINKIDKPGADILKVKTELLHYGVISEDMGGDVMIVPISALKKTNLDKLEEAILLLADMLSIKTSYDTKASGVIIESKVDKTRGALTSLIATRGTLKIGDIIVAGTSYGRVRAIINDKGESLKYATPSMPVEILGLNQPPMAGDQFVIVESDKDARDIALVMTSKIKDNTPESSVISENDFFKTAEFNIKLPIIVKSDSSGLLEAIINDLNKIIQTKVKIEIVHFGIGDINESDLSLAKTSGAIILGFKVKIPSLIARVAQKDKIRIMLYDVIYNLVSDIKNEMEILLPMLVDEEFKGSAEVRQVFTLSKGGVIAGSYVTKGSIMRNAVATIMRDNNVIYKGRIKTIKRLKEDVKEAKEGFECGIAIDGYQDLKIGDKIDVYEIIERKQYIE